VAYLTNISGNRRNRDCAPKTVFKAKIVVFRVKTHLRHWGFVGLSQKITILVINQWRT